MNDASGFAFLGDIRKKLMQSYDYITLCNYSSFQLNEFTEVLKQYMNYYNTHPQKTKSGEIIEELSAAKDIITENVEKLLERDMKLNIIVTKSENLGALSINMRNIVRILLILLVSKCATGRREKEDAEYDNHRSSRGGGNNNSLLYVQLNKIKVICHVKSLYYFK